MLQNVCDKFVRYLVKKVKGTGILIDKPKRETPSIPPLFSTIGHFGDIIKTNFAHRPWYDAIQSPIGSGVEAN